MNILRLIIFTLLNFGALGIGAYLMNGETTGEWYNNLNKAPWTPPGWVFGAAWFSIMLLFSVYMWRMTDTMKNKEKKLFHLVYATHLFLNVIWNPIFFNWHMTLFGLFVILSLSILVLYFLITGFKNKWYYGLLVLPYFIWLCIASSLNVYAVIYN